MGLRPEINWGVLCGAKLAVLDFDSEQSFYDFTATHHLPPNCPLVNTGRGFHIWVNPRRPIRSQRVNAIEVKRLGSYVVAPPSVHPSGTLYDFVVAPNGDLPQVDLEDLLGLGQIDSCLGSRQREAMDKVASS